MTLSAPLVVACLAAIAICDLALWAFDPATPVAAVLDETAHAATALILMAAVVRSLDRWLLAGVLAGAVLIDVDHVPTELGWHGLELSGTRPFPHSLATVCLVLAIALVLRAVRWRGGSTVMLGVALGISLHLVRDFAEPATNSPGVGLLWPLSDHGFGISYPAYAAVIAVAAAASIGRRAGGGPNGQ